MMLRNLTILKILFICIISLNCYGANKKKIKPKLKLIISKPIIKGLDNKFGYEIKKQVVRSVIVSGKYDLLLNNEAKYKNAKEYYQKIEVSVVQNGSTYDINFRRIDSDGIVIQTLSKLAVYKRKLLFQIRILLNNFIKNKGLVNEVSFDKEKLIELDGVSSGILSKNNLSVNSLDSINKNSNKKIANITALEKEKLTSLEHKNRKKKYKKKRINDYNSPNIDVLKVSKKPKELSPTPKIFKFEYNLEMYMENSQNQAKSNVDNVILKVNNNFYRIYPGFSTQLKLRKDYDKKLIASISLGIAVRKQKNDIPISKFLGLNYYDKIFNSPFLFQIGFNYDLDNFNSIGLAGTGLKPWDLNIMWFNVGMLWQFDFISKSEFGPYFSTTFTGSSNYSNSDLVLQGTRIGVNYRFSLLKKYWGYLKFENMTISSNTLSDFSINRTVARIGLEYYF